MITAEINLADIERHCNNDFPNGHTPEFLALAERILQFRNGEQGQAKNIIGESIGNTYKWQAATIDGVVADWTVVFRRELAMYKRAKFI